jgi:hypothetical protein
MKSFKMNRPQFVNGSWRKPALSLRKWNDLRKTSLLLGLEWPADKEKDLKQQQLKQNILETQTTIRKALVKKQVAKEKRWFTAKL